MSLSVSFDLFVSRHITVLDCLHFRKLVKPPYNQSRNKSEQHFERVPDFNVVNNVLVFEYDLNVLGLAGFSLKKVNDQQVDQDKVHDDIKLH